MLKDDKAILTAKVYTNTNVIEDSIIEVIDYINEQKKITQKT